MQDEIIDNVLTDIEVIDYTSYLQEIILMLNDNKDILQAILSIFIVVIVIVLCHYTYKFFNMFF